MARDLEKDLMEIETATKGQLERDNMFTASVLQRCHKLVSELKEYKDLEEQKKLIKLPVAVGDTVWGTTSVANYSLGTYREVLLAKPEERKIISITISKNGILYHVKGRAYSDFDFGKCIFLTKELAEAALKEMSE